MRGWAHGHHNTPPNPQRPTVALDSGGGCRKIGTELGVSSSEPIFSTIVFPSPILMDPPKYYTFNSTKEVVFLQVVSSHHRTGM